MLSSLSFFPHRTTMRKFSKVDPKSLSEFHILILTTIPVQYSNHDTTQAGCLAFVWLTFFWQNTCNMYNDLYGIAPTKISIKDP